MTQNIYDDEAFFEAYGQLERSQRGLAGAPEWPALRALVGDVQGRRVLDLGCGYGWFCRWARDGGAAQVVGVDVSARMLARAAMADAGGTADAGATTDAGATAVADAAADGDSAARADAAPDAGAGSRAGATGIEYRRDDLEHVAIAEGAFDLVYSSLAFHYLTRLDDLAARIHRGLAPGGRLVFSVEHPVITAAHRARWIRGADGEKVWPVTHYFDEGRRETSWLVDGVIKQHRMLGTYVNLLLRAGFTIAHVEDWGPTEAEVAARPDWASERQRPLFLLIAAMR